MLHQFNANNWQYTCNYVSVLDQDYLSTVPYQRRSYTIDNSRQYTINRTSTPYDQSAATKPAMNDSINGISEIDTNSPRYDRLETRYVLGKFRDTTEKLDRSATYTTFCSCSPTTKFAVVLGVVVIEVIL